MRLFPVGVKGGKRSFFFIITSCEGLFLLRAFPVHRTGNLTPTAAGPETKFRGYYIPFLPSINLFIKERFTYFKSSRGRTVNSENPNCRPALNRLKPLSSSCSPETIRHVTTGGRQKTTNDDKWRQTDDKWRQRSQTTKKAFCQELATPISQLIRSMNPCRSSLCPTADSGSHPSFRRSQSGKNPLCKHWFPNHFCLTS